MLEARELDAVVRPALAGLDVPGAAVALVHPGGPPLIRCYGLADIARGVPVDGATRFRVGSVTKTMTAMLIMQLVDAGAIRLDDPVAAHLPHLDVRQRRPGAGPITLRHLLTHSSGIGEIASLASLAHPLWALGAVRPGASPPPLEQLYEGGIVTDVVPGTKWAYSNVAFVLLGMVAEAVTGRAYADLVAERIFAPLGMTHASATRTAEVDAALAVGYRIRRSVPSPVRFLDIAVVPAGGVYASIGDLAEYAGGVLWAAAGDGRLALRKETAREMLSPQWGVDDRIPHVGLSWWLDGVGGTFTAGHGGTVPGFSTGLVLAPGGGIGVAVTLNRGVMPSAAFGGGYVANLVLRRVLGVGDAVAALVRPDAPERPDTWDTLAGVYRPAPGWATNVRALQYFGGEVEVVTAGDHLVARSPAGPFRRGLRLYPADPADADNYRVAYDGHVLPFVFARDAEGDVSAVHTGFTPCPFTLARCPAGTRTYASYARLGAATAGGVLAARALIRRLR